MSFFSKERLRSPILPKSAFLYFHTHSDCTAEAERLRDYKHVWAAPPFYGTGCPSHTERNWLILPLRNMWQWSDSIGKIEPTKSNHDNQVTIILLKFYITAYRGNSSLHNYGIHGPVERGRILG